MFYDRQRYDGSKGRTQPQLAPTLVSDCQMNLQQQYHGLQMANLPRSPLAFGSTRHRTNPAYSMKSTDPSPNFHVWPQVSPDTVTSFNYSHQPYNSAASWHNEIEISSYPEALPLCSRHTLTPSISVTTDFSKEFQPGHAAPPATTSVTSASSLHAPESSFNLLYRPNQLSLQRARDFMNPADQQLQEMQTPPRSPSHQVVPGESMSRKRSHSIMSAGQQLPGQNDGSRSGSVVSAQGHSGEDDYAANRTRAFKREEAPPVNAEQKIICTFAPECAGLTFDRKCEWTKHMDKHDRPYRCANPACAKLQGFTYSGGLLRHEREVHNKHGGPKSALMCPYTDCKRHTGKGFTRKENLNEHVRRVHLNNKDGPAQGTPLKHDNMLGDAFPGADELDSAAAIETDPFDPQDPMSPPRKRQRQDENMLHMNGGSDEMEALRVQYHKLEQERDAKDSEIVALRLQLDAERQSREEEMASMHDSIRQLQEQLRLQALASAPAQAVMQS